jgi:hypothetical protein
MLQLLKAIKPVLKAFRVLGLHPFYFDRNNEVKTSPLNVLFSFTLAIIYFYNTIDRVFNEKMKLGSSWSEFFMNASPVTAAIFFFLSISANFVYRREFQRILERFSTFDSRVNLKLCSKIQKC